MEIKDKVVVTDDDMKLVEDFFQHYNDPKTNNLPMTDRLKSEIAKFRSKSKGGQYSPVDQRNFAIALCNAMNATTHPLLRDLALKEVMDSVATVDNDAQFYDELEKALTSPQDPAKG